MRATVLSLIVGKGVACFLGGARCPSTTCARVPATADGLVIMGYSACRGACAGSLTELLASPRRSTTSGVETGGRKTSSGLGRVVRFHDHRIRALGCAARVLVHRRRSRFGGLPCPSWNVFLSVGTSSAPEGLPVCVCVCGRVSYSCWSWTFGRIAFALSFGRGRVQLCPSSLSVAVEGGLARSPNMASHMTAMALRVTSHRWGQKRVHLRSFPETCRNKAVLIRPRARSQTRIAHLPWGSHWVVW